MGLMSPDVCRPVLMQARAQGDKQGVTRISKWEELLRWIAKEVCVAHELHMNVHGQTDRANRSPYG